MYIHVEHINKTTHPHTYTHRDLAYNTEYSNLFQKHWKIEYSECWSPLLINACDILMAGKTDCV